MQVSLGELNNRQTCKCVLVGEPNNRKTCKCVLVKIRETTARHAQSNRVNVGLSLRAMTSTAPIKMNLAFSQLRLLRIEVVNITEQQ